MPGKLQQHNFSLIELIAVLAIGMLLMGVVTVRSNRIPGFLSLDESARQIGNVLVTASRQAAATGSDMTVIYRAEERMFCVVPATNDTVAAVPQYSNSLKKQFMAYVLPEHIELSFPELENSTRRPILGAGTFYLFPDGTGAGPATVLKLRGKTVKLHLSPLTGSVIIDHSDAQSEDAHVDS